MKTAVVTLGGRGEEKTFCSTTVLIQKINNTGKVCTNGTLKYVHKTTVAAEKQ